VWSRNKANLYIRDALNEFEPNFKHPCFSPPAQHRMYKQKLMATHLIGFGSGVSAPVPSSYLFDGSDSLTTPDHANWDFGASDFTVEAWYYFTSLSGTETLASWYGGGAGFLFRVYDSGQLEFYSGDGGIDPSGGAGDVGTNVWHHVAVSRSGSNVRVFVDGTQTAIDSSGEGDLGDPAQTLTLCGSFNGNMDEFRISDNARYTADFSGSLPTEEYISDANTLVLIHCNETIVSGTTGSGATFVDSGNTGHTFTEGGDAIRNTSTYKF